MKLDIDPCILDLDKKLHELVRDIDILDAVRPENYRDEKKRFFERQYSIEPAFSYRSDSINPFIIKRQLFNLPLESLDDDDLYVLYESVINSYVDKIDQFKSIGSPDLIYDSLRYYGEPTEKDIRNAQFILHLPEMNEDVDDDILDFRGIERVMSEMAAQEGYTWELQFDDTMIANALVSGLKVKINTNARITTTEAKALAHHELGVHLATSLNGRAQALRILSLGCPLNTMTQEGLAILCEYLSGTLSVKRLKILALRVLAVKSMLDEKDFRSTFVMLKEEYHVDDDLAFTITARVYRGGGFTKDHLYLKGFHLMLSAYEQEDNFSHLLVGKTSLDFLPHISRLIEKGYFSLPRFISPALRDPVQNDAVTNFVMHAIR